MGDFECIQPPPREHWPSLARYSQVTSTVIESSKANHLIKSVPQDDGEHGKTSDPPEHGPTAAFRGCEVAFVIRSNAVGNAMPPQDKAFVSPQMAVLAEALCAGKENLHQNNCVCVFNPHLICFHRFLEREEGKGKEINHQLVTSYTHPYRIKS